MARPNVIMDDIQSRYEDDISALAANYVTTKITDAQDQIDVELPVVQKRLDAGTLSVNVYKRVVADMVMRVLRNPEGLSSQMAGDAQATVNPTVASGDLWLTARDIALLTGSGSTTMPGTIGVGIHRGPCAPRW